MVCLYCACGAWWGNWGQPGRRKRGKTGAAGGAGQALQVWHDRPWTTGMIDPQKGAQEALREGHHRPLGEDVGVARRGMC